MKTIFGKECIKMHNTRIVVRLNVITPISTANGVVVDSVVRGHRAGIKQGKQMYHVYSIQTGEYLGLKSEDDVSEIKPSSYEEFLTPRTLTSNEVEQVKSSFEWYEANV